MGRTLPTMIQLIHFEEEQWAAYRRALRQEDREVFDQLWRYVRHFAVSAQMANRPIPFEALLFSMILGLGKEISNLEFRIANLTADTGGSGNSYLKVRSKNE